MKSSSFAGLAACVVLIGASAMAGSPYTVTETCATTPISVGPGVVLSLYGAVGSPPERAGLPAGPVGKFGALLYGSYAASPPLAFGSGSLCISPSASPSPHGGIAPGGNGASAPELRKRGPFLARSNAIATTRSSRRAGRGRRVRAGWEPHRRGRPWAAVWLQ